MSTATVQIKRPKFYDHFTVKPVTTRECSHADCSRPAPFIDGFYLVDTRRVRVWVCAAHRVGSPNLQLPVPFDVQAALDADAAYYAEQRERYKYITERDESVRTFGRGGHGDPIPNDRVKSWRWGA